MPCVSGSTISTKADMRQTMPAKNRKIPHFITHIMDRKLCPTTNVIRKFMAVLHVIQCLSDALLADA